MHIKKFIFILIGLVQIIQIAPRAWSQSAVWQSYINQANELTRKQQYLPAENSWRAVIRELITTDETKSEPIITAHATLGLCLLKQEKFEEAESEFLKAGELAKALQCEPHFVMMYADLGEAEMSLKKYDLAESNFRKSLKILEYSSSTFKRQARVLKDLQSLFVTEGKTTEASALEDQLLKLDAQIKTLEGTPGYHLGKASVLLQNREFVDAIKEYEIAASIAPIAPYTTNLGIARQNYAVSLAGANNEESERQYKLAIKIFEQSGTKNLIADSLEGLVILYLKELRSTEAEPLVKHLLELRDSTKNLAGYTKDQKLYAQIMESQKKPIVIGPVPPSYNAWLASSKENSAVSDYDRQLKNKVSTKWFELREKYPTPTEEPAASVWAIRIRLSINPDGTLKEYKIAFSDHAEKLELRALESIKSIFPYQKLPGPSRTASVFDIGFNSRGVY